MAKQTNQLPKELKQLDAKEIYPSLLYIRQVRGRSVKEEASMPPIKKPSPGPTSVQSINNNLTPTVDSLPPPICQSTPEASSSISAQSSSELDTDQDEMIDETITDVTHKLKHTILTSDIGTINPKRSASTGTSISIKMPSVTDIQTAAVTDNPRQDSTTVLQLPRKNKFTSFKCNPR